MSESSDNTNRLEGRLERMEQILRKDISDLAEKMDAKSDRLETRVRALEQAQPDVVADRVRNLEQKIWMWSGGVGIAGLVLGVVLRRLGL